MTNALTLGEMRGTLAYVPPEIYDGGLFSAKSDIYSLGTRFGSCFCSFTGIVLWELVERLISKKYIRPYEEFDYIQANFQIIGFVSREGLRPTISPKCPDIIANLIEACWHQV